MGIASGSVSYLRFFAGQVPEAFEGPFCDSLYEQRFREIDPHSDVEKQQGWVRHDDVFSADFDPRFLVSPSGQILLKLRVDTLKVPALTLKAYVDQAAREKCRELQRDKLTRRELDALKLELKKVLRVKSLPRIAVLEAVWNVATGEVRLMSTSKASAELFVDLFEKTFHLQLKPVGLLSVLWLRGLSEQDIDALATVEPERFHLIRA